MKRLTLLLLVACHTASPPSPPDAGPVLSAQQRAQLDDCIDFNRLVFASFCEHGPLPNGRKARSTEECERLWRDGLADVEGYPQRCLDSLLHPDAPDAATALSDTNMIDCAIQAEVIAKARCKRRELPNGQTARSSKECETLWRHGFDDVKGYEDLCVERVTRRAAPASAPSPSDSAATNR